MPLETLKAVFTALAPTKPNEVRIGLQKCEVLSVDEGIDNGYFTYRCYSNGSVSCAFTTYPHVENKHCVDEFLATGTNKKLYLDKISNLAEAKNIALPEWFPQIVNMANAHNLSKLP